MGIDEPSSKSDSDWMHLALNAAKKAASMGEVPVGAVIVNSNGLVAEAWNQPITNTDPSAHAEIQALRLAAKKLNNYRLIDCTLYVTVEPCVMCAGALIHARIHRLVYGTTEPKTGAIESVVSVFKPGRFNHTPEVTGGLLADESRDLLQQFFRARRS